MIELLQTTGMIFGFLGFIVVGLLLVCALLGLVYRVRRRYWGLFLMIEAVREHQKNYPDRWKHLDRK